MQCTATRCGDIKRLTTEVEHDEDDRKSCLMGEMMRRIWQRLASTPYWQPSETGPTPHFIPAQMASQKNLIDHCVKQGTTLEEALS